jgi:oxygen-dependent protoporphyrinogen oxidase
VADRSPSDRVVIVGGGLSGLAAAHRVATRAAAMRKPIDLVVLESRDRVGGAVWTDREAGFTLEGGADSFITTKHHGLDLCHELGLKDQLIGPDATFRRSFVVRDGRIVPVPEGFVLMAPRRIGPILTTPVLSPRGKLRMLLDLVRPQGNPEEDESIASFVKRRLGREVLDRLVQPLVGGIYTGDPNELSLRATLPQFAAMERDHGGLIRGGLAEGRAAKGGDRQSSGARYGLFASLIDGMDTLPKALAAALPAGSLRRDSPVRRVTRPEAGGPWLVEPLDGPPIEADGVILATEAHASARLLDAHDPELALHLRSIPYASSAIATVAYHRDDVAHPLDGFGVVIPAIEGRKILAASFTSKKFPGRAPAGTVLMRVFVGGAMQPELYDLDDATIEAIVLDELADLLGARGTPLLLRVARHPRAMPQYTLGHLDRAATIRRRVSRHRRLALAGNYFDGVGVPDVVRSGQEAAESLLKALADPAAFAAA